PEDRYHPVCRVAFALSHPGKPVRQPSIVKRKARPFNRAGPGWCGPPSALLRRAPKRGYRRGPGIRGSSACRARRGICPDVAAGRLRSRAGVLEAWRREEWRAARTRREKLAAAQVTRAFLPVFFLLHYPAPATPKNLPWSSPSSERSGTG